MRMAVVVAVLAVLAIWWWRRSAAPVATLAGSKLVSTAATAPPRTAPMRAQAWRDPEPAGALWLEGQVVGADGGGVAGATVVLERPERSTITEADGSFAFEQLAPGIYDVAAVHGEQIGGPISYRLSARGDPALIRLGGGAAVVVHVVDADAQPIAGARVAVLVGAPARTVRTDARGVARLAPVGIDSVIVEATADGYGPARGNTTVGAPGATLDITVALRRGFPITGRVVNERGAPLANVQVTPQDGRYDHITSAAVVSDAGGAFAIPLLAPGTYRLGAVDGEHAAAVTPPVSIVDRAAGPITIAMAAGGVITGRVVDRAGVPVAAARVIVVGRDEDPLGHRQVMAGADGRFEVRGLARTAWMVRADAAGQNGAQVAVDLTAHAAGEVEVVLDATATIAGVVVDDRGAPAPEVQVLAWRGRIPDRQIAALTDGDGAFVVRGLEDGDYRLDADWRRGGSRGYATDQDFGTAAHTGDRNVRLVLRRTGLVIGKLVLDTGAAPREASVLVGQASAAAGGDGAFRVETVAGAQTLLVAGSEFAFEHRAVTVTEGGTLDLGTIALARGRTLRGKVIAASVEGLRVRVDGDGGDGVIDERALPMRTAPVARDGSFAVYGMLLGPSLVSVENAQHVRSAPQRVPAGKDERDDPPPVTLKL